MSGEGRGHGEATLNDLNPPLAPVAAVLSGSGGRRSESGHGAGAPDARAPTLNGAPARGRFLLRVLVQWNAPTQNCLM